MKEARIQKILNEMHSIQTSDLSVNKYFEVHDVPFSRVQYYTYCRLLKEYGENGLRDRRKDGNPTKLTQRIQDYIGFMVRHEPTISTQELRRSIHNEFDTEISKSSVNDFRKRQGLLASPSDTRPAAVPQASGGGELLTGFAFASGILDVLTTTIMDRVQEIRQTDAFLKNQQQAKEPANVRVHGKFTSAYNQLKSVRESRFTSIDEKIPGKNYATMKVFGMSANVMTRYNLALLCLPLVTSNGRTSRVNRVRGNALTFLCGYNYKDASIDKYLRELKYLKVSEKLVAKTAQFWLRFWKNRQDKAPLFVCYYIDGNTKALWSSQGYYKGKVTMLGRVMNCLENVFIHDGKGHPLYFQTFHGHADLGKHALQMITELTKHCDDEQISITRILVLDGGGNSVKTMRAFQRSHEYFMTILDKNQLNARKFKHLSKETEYLYGAATLVDCRIELPDSSEKDYLYESRAVMVNWHNGRQSVLVTNIPCEIGEASTITKSYFDRWPLQEKQFRDAKSGVNMHRIVGYGKKTEPYDTMREKCHALQERIQVLTDQLQAPLKDLDQLEKELESFYQQERKLREQSSIEDGKRVLSQERMDELAHCERQINRCLRQQKSIEKPHKKAFTKLRKCRKEEQRIRLKDTVYRIDTELDQIMTCFKLSFVNLCSLFLSECMNGETYELLTLFESIFQLDGQAVIIEGEKHITLSKNFKEPKLMKKLEEAMSTVNEMKMINLDGRHMKFQMGPA